MAETRRFYQPVAVNGTLSVSGATTLTGAVSAGAVTSTNAVLTTPSIASPVVTGSAGTGIRIVKQALFTEDATSLTHTATFTIPAGALLVDIWAVPQVLWTGGTAKLDVGDAGSATGYFNAIDLKATDLVLGERLQASNANNWGGKNGAYLTTAGRFGLAATNCIGGYCISDYNVIAVVTVGTPATTAGRLRVYVEYMVGESVVPVLA